MSNAPWEQAPIQPQNLVPLPSQPAPAADQHPAIAAVQKLPVIMAENKQSADNAETALRPKLNVLKSVKFDAINPDGTYVYDGQGLTAYDTDLNNEMARLKSTKELLNGKRSPITKAFDEVRTYFTDKENKVEQLMAEFKGGRLAIASEINRRQKIEEDKRKKEQAKISLKQMFCEAIQTGFNTFLTDALTRMVAAYNNCDDVEKLQNYINALAAYIPVMATLPAYPVLPWNVESTLLTSDEIAVVRGSAESEMLDKLNRAFQNTMIIEKDKLIQAAPLRDFSAPVHEATVDVVAAVEVQAVEVTETIQTEAVAATFETIATMQPTVTQAAGIKTKQKYDPKTHVAFIEIMKYWTSNHMHLLTIEELSKKLSFMVTAANKSLNEGTVLKADGLVIVDDINTRVTR